MAFRNVHERPAPGEKRRRVAASACSHSPALPTPCLNDEAWGHPTEYMLPLAAAEYTRVSTSFLAKLRMVDNRPQGPAFVKIGRVVLYRRVDLDRWLASRVVEGP